LRPFAVIPGGRAQASIGVVEGELQRLLDALELGGWVGHGNTRRLDGMGNDRLDRRSENRGLLEEARS
jgi:hypothetical protein